MDREHAFDAFAVGDAADDKGGVEAPAAAADDDACEDLDAFLVAFDDLGMDADGISDVKLEGGFAELFRFDLV